MSESSTSSSSASANQFSSESAVDSDSALGITVYPLPLQQPSKTRRSGRLKMILVLLVCALPLVASYFTYYVVRPQARNNYGQLIAPQRPLPNAQVSSALAPVHNIQNLRDLKGQWLLLSASGANCGVDCERNLYLQRQLREALGREKEPIAFKGGFISLVQFYQCSGYSQFKSICRSGPSSGALQGNLSAAVQRGIAIVISFLDQAID